jgi:glycosyltransferase involved in cell wall biosynthesis
MGLNVLFVLYNDMSSNSAGHADGLCRALSALGHHCVIAVPQALTRAELVPDRPYAVITHAEALAGPRLFAGAAYPDIVHAWTPREIVRGTAERLAEPGSTRLCVHLEDNEARLARGELGETRYALYREGLETAPFPQHLSHPVHARSFLASADGASVLVDALLARIPDIPATIFWPSADERIFFPRPPDPQLRRELGVPPGATMLCYHGNTHASNRAEVRSLYLAVALLNRRAHPARLVRMGQDHVGEDAEYRRWASEFAVELGFVEDRRRLGRIVAEADVLVQPGRSDSFNDYRFPSKLPEFFASGKPVVLPRANIGLVTRHGEDAYVLDNADGTAIADAVLAIMSDASLRERLAKGARAFHERQPTWSIAAHRVAALYERILALPPRRNRAAALAEP